MGKRPEPAAIGGLPPSLLAVAAVGFVVGLDVTTKRWAEAVLRLGEAVPLVGDIARLRLGYNSGIAFGFLPQAGAVWLLTAGVLVVAVAAWLVRELRAAPPSPPILPLVLILGGGLANLLDRWPDGRVTDIIDIGVGITRWPTFNLADAAITLGIVALLAASLGPRRARTEEEHADG